MKKIPKWLKITGGVLLALIIIGGLSSSGEKNKTEEAKVEQAPKSEQVKEVSRCEEVPANIVANINEGFNTEGLTFRNAKAVKSNDFVSLYFVSGDIQGAGLEGDNDIATFMTNKIDTTGVYESVDGVAKEFSVFPDASTTDARATMSNDGAKESQACVNG